ncbi:MAG: hydrolase [Clostridia bacterium]|nr:hydrolase [Clostridia bacterium]
MESKNIARGARFKLALPKYRCACCGCYTLSEPAGGSFEICPVCFWEDDRLQLNDPSYPGGANGISLEEARLNYQRFGVSREDLAPYVRPPRKSELRNAVRGEDKSENDGKGGS